MFQPSASYCERLLLSDDNANRILSVSDLRVTVDVPCGEVFPFVSPIFWLVDQGMATLD